MIPILSILLSTLVARSSQRSTGAPGAACSSITPGHGGSSGTLPGGYYIYSDLVDAGGSYEASTSYNIRLEGNADFRGFLIQARTAGTTTPIGTFNTPSNSKHLSCSGQSAATVTHTNKNFKSSMTFTWTSPSTAGTVEFRYAVVKSFSNYFANIDASDHRPPGASSSADPSTPAPTTTTTTMQTTTDNNPSSTSSNVASSTKTSVESSSSSAIAVSTTTDPAPVSSTVESSSSSAIDVSTTTDDPPISSTVVSSSTSSSTAMISSSSPSTSTATTMETTLIGTSISTSSVAGDGSSSTDQLITSTSFIMVTDSTTSGTVMHSSLSSSDHAATNTDMPSLATTTTSQFISSLSTEQFVTQTTESSSKSVKPTNPPSGCPNTNKNADSSFPIVFGTPDGCERSDCTYYWAMGPNNEDSSYVDIYLEGNVNGWIAVGFSENKQMTMTDVLACRVVSGSNVEVIDTWNDGYNNGIDDSQDGVCTHMTNYDGQRLKCLFSRNSAEFDLGKDFNLDDSLYIIRGYRISSNTGSSLDQHSVTPQISAEQYNVLSDTNTEISTDTTTTSTQSTIASTTSSTMASTSPPEQQLMDCPSAPATDANYATELNAPGADYYFGARVNDDNSSYLDITLEGVADGWVAIGFSDSNNMFNSDVFGCKREESGDNVNVIDTWNPSGARTNLIDDTQSGICQHTTEYTDGRIKCTFSRLIDPNSNIGQDLNLNDTLYQIYNAISSNRGSSDSGLGPHSKIPTLSENKMSLATDALTGRQLEATEWPKKPLIQTHGVFMIISWILLAGTGIFFASWMKPTLPNGEWFQAHRALMVASLFAGVIGFIFAFIAHARNTEVAGIINFSEPNRGIKIVHFLFGWVIILFHISNPIIAIFRCAPGKPKRWIFNLIHGHLVGLIVFLIAVANVGMGIFLIEKSQSSYDTPRALILYAVFIAVLLCLQLILFIVYTIKGMKAPEEDCPKLVHSLLRYCIGGVAKESQKVQLTDMDKEKNQSDEKQLTDMDKEMKQPLDEKPPRKQPHKDAPVTISWISAALHMVLTVVVVLILIILIAIV